jgi:hypothetical protein
LLVLDPETLQDDDKKMLAHVRHNEAIAQFCDLAQDFRTLLRDRNVEAFDTWLVQDLG